MRTERRGATAPLAILTALLMLGGVAQAAAAQPFDPPSIDPVAAAAGDVLISQTDGVLWLYDPDTGDLASHALPFGGTWDIQWDGPRRVLIANSSASRIWRLDLATGELDLIAEGDPLGFPIGLALDPTDPGALWIADHFAGILRLDRSSGDLEVVVPPFEGAMDGIVVGSEGTVYFTNQSGVVYRVASEAPLGYEPVVDVGPYGLNGLVFDPAGALLATSTWPSAVAEIDVAAGTFTVHDFSTAMRSAEDTAVGGDGLWWVIDSGFVAQFGDDPGLYTVDPSAGVAEVLRGAPLGDAVDLLIVPALSTGDCKDGGWRSLVDGTGTPFANQGDCVSYVSTGGRNPARG